MRLSADQIKAQLKRLQGWTSDGQAIQRQYTFDGFATAIAFVVRIGFHAEAADHHPDILIAKYKTVTLTFTTHSAGGLTQKDVEGAAAADQVFGAAR